MFLFHLFSSHGETEKKQSILIIDKKMNFFFNLPRSSSVPAQRCQLFIPILNLEKYAF